MSESIAWSPAQLCVIDDVVLSGKSMYLSGGGGTGKSRVVQEIKRRMLAAKRKVVVTAMTGRAAVNIGGITFHSFLRLGPHELDTKSAEQIAEEKRSNKYFAKDVRAVGLLIVDEISMMEPRLFAAADIILQRLRDRPEPFGGLQVLFVGDFSQLPPVGTPLPLSGLALGTAGSDGELVAPLVRVPKFIFQTELFFHLIEEMHDLKEVWRQADSSFVELLNRMRRGELTEADVAVLQSRLGAELPCEDGILPTQLSSNNAQVDASNLRHLRALPDASVVYALRSGVVPEQRIGRSDERRGSFRRGGGGSSSSSSSAKPEPSAGKDAALLMLKDKLIKDLNISEGLELKLGAQVMLTINYDTERGLVNGTRGVVIGFSKPVGDKPAATTKTYAADPESVFSLPTVEEPIAYPDEPMAIVQFDAPEGSAAAKSGAGIRMQAFYYRWQRETPGLGTAFVWQVPLRLAWSSTIHKSQGQSISKVDISLDSKVFECGQAYVAVSRVRSLQGLRFSAFEPSVIRSDPCVLDFYKYPFSTQRAAVLDAARRRMLGSVLGNEPKRARIEGKD